MRKLKLLNGNKIIMLIITMIAWSILSVEWNFFNNFWIAFLIQLSLASGAYIFALSISNFMTRQKTNNEKDVK